MSKVGIVMGSASDLEVMENARKTLNDFGVENEMRILSAHRTPDEAAAWVRDGEQGGIKVFIAAAGMAAHLAGAVAANTTLPVLGVPLKGGIMDGLDSLLSTVQMPKGVPVATFAVGKAGAINAAIHAVKILAVSDEGLAEKLKDFKVSQREMVLEADSKL